MPEILQNKTIAFTRNELIDGGVMTIHDYHANINRGKMVRINRACKGTEALIAYDENMHKDIKAKIVKIFGQNITEIAKQNPLKKYLIKDIAAEDFFAEHKYEGTDKHIKKEKQIIYAANAVAYNAISNFLNDRKTYRKVRGGTGVGKSTWPDIIAALKAYAPEWGWKLPYSERNLRQNIADYKDQGYIALISGKDTNSNAVAVKETEQQATLRQLLRHPNNLNDEQVLIMYNEIASRLDWRKISAGTIANRRVEWNLTIISARRGAQYFNNNVAMQHKRSAPGYPLKFWTMDGWDAELLYQKQTINANGHSVTTYHNRPTVIQVMDAFTNYIIGYAIGTHETPALIKEALKNALLHTKEIFGCMYRPNQLQTDNYQIKNLTPLYEAVSPRFTPAAVKNAKAKPIEPHFAKFNTKYFQYAHNWSGHNVTASPHNQPNEEYRDKVKHNFPDEAGCHQQIIDAIETDRQSKLQLFKEKFAELPTEYKLPWSTAQYLYNIGDTTGFTNKLQGSGLTLTINKTPVVFDCFDADFREYAHLDWVVKYDLNDMSTALAHSIDGTHRFLLTQKYIQPMALVDRTEGDSTQLALTNNYNKQLKEKVLNQMATDGDAVAALFNQYPQLDDTLAKMRISDSLGQHKDNKNNQRIQQAATKTIAKQERKQVAAATAEKQMAYNEYIDGKINIEDYL